MNFCTMANCFCLNFARTNPEEALCITSASGRQRSGKVKMKFDKGDRQYDKELFEYVDDPTIESAESGVAGQVNIFSVKIYSLLLS